jgi:ATPase components of ABC transporters with duplicated ATPase domains
LEGTTRLADALTGESGDSVIVGGQQKHVMSYLQDFLFTPEQARTQISALSGGERGRLMLARAFTLPSNILVLD